MKKNLMQKVEAYCNICEKETEFEMIGVQNYNGHNGRYALYNCVECDGTHTLLSLLILSNSYTVRKELEAMK